MTALSLIGLSVSTFAADAQRTDLVRLLPQNAAVKGWKVIPNSLQYASDDGLTDIYDGGYELYTKNGVIAAAQQMYRFGKDTATVVIHRMASPADAKKFYEYWKTSDKKQPTFKLLKVGDESYVYTADGAANAYFFQNTYFVTTSVYIDGEKGKTAATEFLKVISASIDKATRKSGKNTQ